MDDAAQSKRLSSSIWLDERSVWSSRWANSFVFTWLSDRSENFKGDCREWMRMIVFLPDRALEALERRKRRRSVYFVSKKHASAIEIRSDVLCLLPTFSSLWRRQRQRRWHHLSSPQVECSLGSLFPWFLIEHHSFVSVTNLKQKIKTPSVC